MRYIYLVVLCRSLVMWSQVFGADVFPDIQEHLYRESIERLQDRGIIQWYPDGSFGPERWVTRAEMLKVVLKTTLEDTDDEKLKDCFPDVGDERYASYVCYAKINNIVKWYPDGTFKPNNQVTIAEWLKIALETFDQPIIEWSGNNRYTHYIDFVHTQGIFSRFDINPDKEMTRAQIAFLVDQLLLAQEGQIVFQPIEQKVSNMSQWCNQISLPAQEPTTVDVRNVQRSYITTVGDTVTAEQPTKLIVAFHGRTSPNTEVRRYYGLEKVWDEDAIIVYPSGLPEQWPSRNRRATDDESATLRWFEFFDEIVDEISSNYCIDMDQIYVVGHSLWAWFANSLTCARGDVIRAVWTVAWGTTNNECTWTAAALIMHNPNDRLSAYAGWEMARDQLLSQNQCWSDTRPVWPAEWNCVEYTNCQAWSPVVRCPHTQDIWRSGTYYPHTWPDFAGQMIWDFFEIYD